MSILIKNILFKNQITDVFVEGDLISQIGENIQAKADVVISGEGKALIPGLINAHSHAAMTLFRGWADDMALEKWLNEKIWPAEARLTEDDVYWGAKLACLEMIKSGTTAFNDMYWHLPGSARAVREMGLRGVLSAVIIDFFDQKKARDQIRINEELFAEYKNFDKNVIFALGPHSIYTVSRESLEWAAHFARRNDLLVHIHVSETEREVDECQKKYGVRPFEYLEKIGFLGPNVIAAHALWLSDNEIEICARFGVKIAHNPVSNLKLASGNCFEYKKLTAKNIKPALGTDGCASNNSLDLLADVKIAALLQKSNQRDTTALPAQAALEMITLNGAKALNINSGEIKAGKRADLVLINLDLPELTPFHNLEANLVYSANGSCVDTVICGGKVLMQNRVVPGEEEILRKAQEAGRRIAG